MTTSLADTATADPSDLAIEAPPPPLREFWRGFSRNPGALIGLIYFVFIIFCAIGADVLATHSPSEQYRDAILSPPFWADAANPSFLLGTDDLGRDMLSRLLHGARLSLLIGLCSVLLSMGPGIILGLLAAFYPRWLGNGIARLMDIMLALPALLLAVAVVAVLGPGLLNTMIAIAIVNLPQYVRLTRASAMTELHKDYVIATVVANARLPRLMFMTVLPNCMAPLIVTATMGFSSAILDAAALGFLGLGAQPPLPEWGTMLANARDYIESANWVVTLPGLAILTTVLAINLMGDGLRDALDPKLRQIG
jgi:dipeptide transport system permease protein